MTSHLIRWCLAVRCRFYVCCQDFLFLLGFQCLGVTCLGMILLLGVLPWGHRSSWIFKFTTFGNIAAIVSSGFFFFLFSVLFLICWDGKYTYVRHFISFRRCSSFLSSSDTIASLAQASLSVRCSPFHCLHFQWFTPDAGSLTLESPLRSGVFSFVVRVPFSFNQWASL